MAIGTYWTCFEIECKFGCDVVAVLLILSWTFLVFGLITPPEMRRISVENPAADEKMSPRGLKVHKALFMPGRSEADSPRE